MIDAERLTKDCRKLVTELEKDLQERLRTDADLEKTLKAEYAAAKDAGRFGHTFNQYCDEQFTQSAVAWVLAYVFVRFLEDNGLLRQFWIAGVGEGLKRARDEREHYFGQEGQKEHSDRDYLEMVFREVAKLPGCAALLDERHNALWHVPISGDAAGALLKFFQAVDPDTGTLRRDFTDPDWNTRFLGDLYQDLSESARKKYALLQTPEFVEEFILDLALEPAVEEFGLAETTVIDPTCGSGHFLLGAFHRLLNKWAIQEPQTASRELAQRALVAVAGVDVNPFAVAVARFRLLIAALKASGVRALEKAPAFTMHLAAGDSLLHGPRFSRAKERGGIQATLDPEEDLLRHVFETEDREELRRILGRQYAVVVGNPPYITVKDKALNQAYRAQYDTCHMKYSLGVPFTERFFDLASAGNSSGPVGYVGMITTNSFMKREFGSKLIEEYLPTLDLTHVIDTSGAYIPGHGTPTVILSGRNRRPQSDDIRTVMGIRGEPSTPEDPSQGLVWRSVVDLLDQPGAENDFVSVADKERGLLAQHPWSLQGGGAVELKATIEAASTESLADVTESIGITSFTLEDDVFLLTRASAYRRGMSRETVRPMVVGEAIRDWSQEELDVAVFPYDEDFRPLEETSTAKWRMYLWPTRTMLSHNKMFGGKTKVETGLSWYEFGRLTSSKLRTPLSIAFAFVATHNHFVLDRGGKVFNRSAPVIKLGADATEEDHLALLGLLNSSTACFWMKQVFHCKGSTVDDKGARQTTVPFEDFYEYTGTGLQDFPVPAHETLVTARRLDELATEQASLTPTTWLPESASRLAELDALKRQSRELLQRRIALQEELDWQVYRANGLIDQDLTLPLDQIPAIELGQRAFEIVLARKVAAGETTTTWFERHGSTPITEIPSHWPAEYRRLVERRIELIESDRNIRLIERPEYKRRWNTEPWDKQVERACRTWLLTRLEHESIWPRTEPQLLSCAQLADCIRADEDVQRVAEVYTGRTDFDLTKLVEDLVKSDSVPFLASQRFKPSGLRKFEDWQHTWELQRQEDEIDARTQLPASDPNHLGEVEAKALKREQVGDISVPPKYKSSDFRRSTIWQLRGKLDVPKERFFGLPGCEREGDKTLVLGWAGWNHLEQVQAIVAYYTQRKEHDGWPAERLVPLLAGIQERLFWVKMWHNEIDPQFGTRMGDAFEGFVQGEMSTLGIDHA